MSATPLSREELAEIRVRTTERWIKKNGGPPDWDTATIKRLLASYDEAATAAARHACEILRRDLVAVRRPSPEQEET